MTTPVSNTSFNRLLHKDPTSLQPKELRKLYKHYKAEGDLMKAWEFVDLVENQQVRDKEYVRLAEQFGLVKETKPFLWMLLQQVKSADAFKNVLSLLIETRAVDGTLAELKVKMDGLDDCRKQLVLREIFGFLSKHRDS